MSIVMVHYRRALLLSALSIALLLPACGPTHPLLYNVHTTTKQTKIDAAACYIVPSNYLSCMAKRGYVPMPEEDARILASLLDLYRRGILPANVIEGEFHKLTSNRWSKDYPYDPDRFQYMLATLPAP